jgi:phage portal protein BeeE
MPVAIDEAILSSQLSMFQRGIHPSHVLTIGKNAGPDGTVSATRPTLSAAQRRQLVNAVKAIYAGASKSGEPLILDGIVESVTRLSNTAAELDWTESGQSTKARITQIFGVNPIILGELEGANRASSLAAEEHLASTINPKLQLMGQTLTEYLGPRFGVVIWFDQYTPKDFEAELKRMQLLAQYGAIELNELRAWAGLPPVDYGNMPLAQSGGIDQGIASMIDQRLATIGAGHVFNSGKNGHAMQRN